MISMFPTSFPFVIFSFRITLEKIRTNTYAAVSITGPNRILPVLPADKRKRRTYPVKCTEDNINRKWLPVSNADKDSGVKFPHQFCMGLLTFFIPFCHIYRVWPHNGNGNLLLSPFHRGAGCAVSDIVS